MNRSRTVLAAAIAAASAAAVDAQAPAPATVLDHLGVRRATVQALTLPAEADGALSVAVVLDGVPRTLDLHPCDLRAPGFRVLVDDGEALREVPSPAPRTLRGSVRGVADGSVAAAWVDGGLSAMVLLGDETWGVQPMPGAAATHVVYRRSDLRLDAARCGTHAPARPVPGGGPAASTNVVAEIALDADHQFYVRKNGITGAVDAMLATLNSVDLIYQRDAGIQYLVTRVIVRSVPLYRSDTPDLQALLDEFTNEWETNLGHIQRDMAHLFTGRGQWSGVIGRAWVGTVCSRFGYGVSRAFHANEVANVLLVAHELGHNWNSGHCDGNGLCHIMCSQIGGCSGGVTRLGPAALARITQFKGVVGCLSSPTEARYEYLGQGCIGSNGRRPTLRATNTPIAGRVLDLTVRDAPARSNGWLVFSASATRWGGLLLPFDLGPFGAPGCSLFVSIDSYMPLITGSGSIDIGIRVPGDMAGQSVYHQCMFYDPVNPLGLVATNGGAARIGTH